MGLYRKILRVETKKMRGWVSFPPKLAKQTPAFATELLRDWYAKLESEKAFLEANVEPDVALPEDLKASDKFSGLSVDWATGEGDMELDARFEALPHSVKLSLVSDWLEDVRRQQLRVSAPTAE